MFRVIAISGNRCVGKDTLYNSLKNLNSNLQRYAFADALKNDLKSLIWEQFEIDIFNASGKEKEFVRPILTSYGCVWRDREPEHWCKTICEDIKKDLIGSDVVPVITDLRFRNELDLLRKEFGSNLYHINIEREDSIEPTAEEKLNINTINHLADYNLRWGNNRFEEISDIAKTIYDCIFYKNDS